MTEDSATSPITAPLNGITAPLNGTADPIRDRYLVGLAQQVDLDPARLASPGTTILGRPDRVDSGAAVGYWADRHALIWADPAVVDRLDGLGSDTETLTAEALGQALTERGFDRLAEADMCTLAPQHDLGAHLFDADAGAFEHRWLDARSSTDVDLVKSFVARSDPTEVEHAGLDEIDDHFDELAINVLIDRDPSAGADAGSIVAYASATRWDWDAEFLDIGVLVDPAHRRKGLAVFAVAHTTTRLLADGLLPLYRYETFNLGSGRVAETLGFRPAAKLAYYRLP